MDVSLFIADSLAASVRLGTPLLLAALGELVVQRSGVLNIGLEGLMLVAAFTGVATADVALAGGCSNSTALALGTGAALAAGLIYSAGFAVTAVLCRWDQIVCGMALNLAAIGLTGTLHRGLFLDRGELLSVETFEPIALPLLSDIPILGRLFEQSLPVYIAYLAVPLVTLLLYRSRWGLTVRAAGDNPRAVDASGRSVAAVRCSAILFGGLFGGLAGATLTLADASSFAGNMTAGRGFIALAVVIFGRWHPGWVALVALFFGAANAAQYRLQAVGLDGVPHQLLLALPYLASLLALAWSGGRPGAAPSALGKAYRRSERERES